MWVCQWLLILCLNLVSMCTVGAIIVSKYFFGQVWSTKPYRSLNCLRYYT